MTIAEWHNIDNYICEYYEKYLFPAFVAEILSYIYQLGYPTFKNFDECIMTLKAYFSMPLKGDIFDIVNNILMTDYHLKIISKTPLKIKRSQNG